MKTIYNLRFHEYVTYKLHQYTRVPGGWIVESKQYADTSSCATDMSGGVLVPYNEEFKAKELTNA